MDNRTQCAEAQMQQLTRLKAEQEVFLSEAIGNPRANYAELLMVTAKLDNIESALRRVDAWLATLEAK